jgi:TetR/AcrR family transcriptional regulator, regulator of mycofactocin system
MSKRGAAVAGLRAKKTGLRAVEIAARLPMTSLVQRTRQKRSELIIAELESVALAMFEQRGFSAVTVEDIAAQAQISTRTFYRYFTVKEDLLQVTIRRRADAITAALATRPAEEPPLRSVRFALQIAVSAEDPALLMRWIDVVAATPSVLRAVLGGCMLSIDNTIAVFLGARLKLPRDAFVPTMLSAAAGGIIQAAQTRWRLRGGADLATSISEGLRILEEGIAGNLATLGRGKRNVSKSAQSPARRK